MSNHRKNRQWFSSKLQRFFWSREIAPLLLELDCGWLDGGCYTCAKGLYRYLIISATIDPSMLSFSIVIDQHQKAHHVVIGVQGATQVWFLDAKGVSSAQRLLHYWAREEHLTKPQIEACGDTDALESAIPSSDAIADRLAECLLTILGPYDPAWLEGDPQHTK